MFYDILCSALPPSTSPWVLGLGTVTLHRRATPRSPRWWWSWWRRPSSGRGWWVPDRSCTAPDIAAASLGSTWRSSCVGPFSWNKNRGLLLFFWEPQSRRSKCVGRFSGNPNRGLGLESPSRRSTCAGGFPIWDLPLSQIELHRLHDRQQG